MDDWRASMKAWHVSRRYKPGEFGSARIEFYTASALDALRGGMRGENIREGSTVAQLLVKGQMVMSDSDDELRDHSTAIHRATGRVLIHGLGLGCYLSAVLAKPCVSSVDVVEINQDVLTLVGPYFEGDPRVNFVHGDAFSLKWPRGTRWNCVWHDIWPNKCADDLKEHSRLLRSFGRRCDWQACWAHEHLLWRR